MKFGIVVAILTFLILGAGKFTRAQLERIEEANPIAMCEWTGCQQPAILPPYHLPTEPGKGLPAILSLCPRHRIEAESRPGGALAIWREKVLGYPQNSEETKQKAREVVLAPQ